VTAVHETWQPAGISIWSRFARVRGLKMSKEMTFCYGSKLLNPKILWTCLISVGKAWTSGVPNFAIYPHKAAVGAYLLGSSFMAEFCHQVSKAGNLAEVAECFTCFDFLRRCGTSEKECQQQKC